MGILFRERTFETGRTWRPDKFQDELDSVRPAGRTLEVITIGVTVELLGTVDTDRMTHESCSLIKFVLRGF